MYDFGNPRPIATAEQFKQALLAVRNRHGITTKNLAMLQAHCRAPAHTITTTKLAEELGLPSYSTANMQYGGFAHLVADELHYKPGPFKSGNAHWWLTLAYGNEGEKQNEEGHYEWIMRPELVQALQEMKWV